MRKFSIPFVALESDAPLESVCRVFETINSTGTRLTTFDLAVARYYPDPNLNELFDDSKRKYEALTEYEIDGEKILQTLALYDLKCSNSFPEATRSRLLKLQPEFIRDHWESAALQMAEACKLIKALGATAKTQPSGMLVSIAATLMCFPGGLSSGELKKWYFCTTLAANPAPTNNYKIGEDFRRFCNFIDKKESLQFPRVYFAANDIIEIKGVASNRYKAIQALMRTTVKEDLTSGNSLDGDVEDHHIFPYALVKSGFDKDRLNSIANRIMVAKKSNRDIGNTNPDKYLVDLAKLHRKEGTTADFDLRLVACLIPYSSDDPNFEKRVGIESFNQFLDDRAQVIADRIKQVVGTAWQAPSDDEDQLG